MIQKIIVSILFLTVVSAAGVGVYDAMQPAASSEALIAPETVAQADTAEDTVTEPVMVADAQTDTAVVNEETIAPAAQVNPLQVQQQANTQTTEQMQAMDMVGESWTSTGTIAGMDDTGLTLAQDDGTELFVELGPSTYWQAQGITLSEGDTITIDGFSSDAGIHAAIVTTASGEQLTVRTASGQPMWSGGATNANGQGVANANEPNVQPDEWVTMTATISNMTQGNITALTEDGTSLQIQLGQPSFWQSQGITFNIGDAIEVLGFWEGANFRSGEIRIPATEQRLMLLDPNGRPLWAGPGRNGNTEGNTATYGSTTAADGSTTDHTSQSGSNGQGNQGNGNQASSGNQGSGNQGNGNQTTGNQGSGNQGNGNQGNGNQGAGNSTSGNGQGNQNQVTGLPSTQWQTFTGQVVGVEALTITIQTEDGIPVTVGLGEIDFWTDMGYQFVIPEIVTVDGYWQNTVFEAGQVTFGDGTGTFIVRDNDGTLVWTNTSGNGSTGKGNQYRGGRS